MTYLIIREYGKIFRSASLDEADRNNLDSIHVQSDLFNALQKIIDNHDSTPLFRSGRLRGKSYLQVQNYVGIIEVKNKLTLEILPKIEFQTEQQTDLAKTRRLFLQMLSSLQHSPFQQLGTAHLQPLNLPLTEIFITAFVNATLTLVQKGLYEEYNLRESHHPYLRGKLSYPQQFKNDLSQRHRFFTKNDSLKTDNAANRLLKHCIDFLSKKTNNYQNQKDLALLQKAFVLVPYSIDWQIDLQTAQAEYRLYPQYELPLIWAKIFLQGNTFSNITGKYEGLSLLFPTERIFEDYIGLQFSKNTENYKVSLQDRRHHLLETQEGTKKFTLRPDIIVENENELYVIDIKWKKLNPKAKNYGIAQSDLYQLFSYGQKYAQSNKTVRLLIIYPPSQGFTDKLPDFYFKEQSLPLQIYAYDFEKTPIENLSRFFAKIHD